MMKPSLLARNLLIVWVGAVMDYPSVHVDGANLMYAGIKSGSDIPLRVPREGDSQAALTVLLVEDENFVREVTSEVLRCAGYRVFTARNATEAQRIYDKRSHEIDLLLTDVVLPGETGRALATKLRRENPYLPVLLASGYGEELLAQGDAPGEFLAKPFSSKDLLQKVRETIRQSPLRRSSCSSALVCCS